MLQEFLSAINFNEYINNKATITHVNGANRSMIIRKNEFIIEAINDNSYKVILQNFTETTSLNTCSYFAEIYFLYDNNVIYINRNSFTECSSTRRKSQILLGGSASDLIEMLPSEITLNEKVYKRKTLGFDNFYIHNDLEEDQIYPINSYMSLVKIRCTFMKGIYLPSKKAVRYFLLQKGMVYNENSIYPSSYDVFKTPTLNNSEDIIIISSYKHLASIDYKLDPNVESLRPQYLEAVTQKLLNLK